MKLVAEVSSSISKQRAPTSRASWILAAWREMKVFLIKKSISTSLISHK